MWVHQIWFDLGPAGRTSGCPSAGQMEASERWRDENRVHNYHMWSLVEAVRLCDRSYPDVARVLRRDDLGSMGIVKCDLFRYVLMHHLGGVYADLDFVPLRSVDDILRSLRASFPANRTYLFEEWPRSSREHPTPRDGTVHNGLLISEGAGDAFWMKAIRSCLANLGSRPPRTEGDVFLTTGTKMLRDLAVRDEVCIVRDYVACPTICVMSSGESFDAMDEASSDRAFQALERMRGLPSDVPAGVTVTVQMPPFGPTEGLRTRFPHSLAALCHFAGATSHWRRSQE